MSATGEVFRKWNVKKGALRTARFEPKTVHWEMTRSDTWCGFKRLHYCFSECDDWHLGKRYPDVNGHVLQSFERGDLN